jgi:Holliday junction resolvase RusA-like endonuclease
VSYKLTIPRIPCSPNALLGKHWSAKRKEKEDWQLQIFVAINDMLGIAKIKAKGKMRVTITLYNARQYDRDNCWGSVKPILDAMVALGLLVDDRAEFCELEVRQEKSSRKDKRTVIEVEPI